jgi:hypothetical protein
MKIRNDLCWSHRVDVLDADNRVHNIHFVEDPTENLGRIMGASPFPKNCLMQGMLYRKYHLLDSTTQPVTGGFGSWKPMNCVLYETQKASGDYKFEYTRTDSLRKPSVIPLGGSVKVYTINDRNDFFLKKKNRFDLEWDEEDTTKNLCLAAPDEDQKKAWISAFKHAGHRASEHPQNAVLGKARKTHKGASSKSSWWTSAPDPEKTYVDDNLLYIQGQGYKDRRYDAYRGNNM